MAWHAIWSVRCERCDALGPLREKSLDAEAAALAEGWKRGIVNKTPHHLCRECVKAGRAMPTEAEVFGGRRTG